jgi:hypothetical protein
MDEFDEVVRRSLAAAVGDTEGAGDPDSVIAGFAQHLAAPVQATLIAVSGVKGVAIRYTVADDRILVVAQPLVGVDGEVRPYGDVQLIFARPSESWATVAQLLPPFDALRAGSITRGRDFEESLLPLSDARWGSEEANLQVRVEARPRRPAPAVVWGRWWSVIDGDLFDVRRRDGEMVGVARPAGSVAAEFEWALVGAFDAVRAGESHGG